MATTTMGQTTPDIRSTSVNRATYWIIAAALAILLIFAYTASRQDSTLVNPTDQQSIPGTIMAPSQRSPAMESAPAMDSFPANSVNAPRDPAFFSPNSDIINNGAISDPIMMTEPLNRQDPGTSVSPDAPKGTVER